MADNVAVTAGSGTSIAADEVVDATLGTVKVQMVKIMDGTLDGTNKMKILGASTAPAATDPAVVVAIHPLSQTQPGQVAAASSLPIVVATEQSFGGQNVSSASKQAFLIGGQFNTTPTTITSGNLSPLQLDASGNLKVNAVVAQGSTTSTQLGALTQGAVTTAAPSYTNAQTSPLSLTTAGALRVDGSAVTQPVNALPATSGGLSKDRLLVSGTTGHVVKASPGQLYKIRATNTSATPAYIKLYDAASAPTAGAGTIIDTILIPGNTQGAGILDTTDLGFPHSTGIAYCVTGGIADADTTAPPSNAIVVTFGYK